MRQQKILEKDIQATILDYLALKKYMFWRQNTNPIFSEGHFRSMPKYSKNGVPDIILILQGSFVGLEVKRPKEKQSEDQKQFEIDCLKAGGQYHVVTCLEDVMKLGL